MTAKNVFDIAMTLINETPVNGVFDADKTADYVAKYPYLLTNIQSEICRMSPLYKSLNITANTELESGYTQVTLPSDYISIYQLIDNDLAQTDDYKVIGQDLYVPYDFNGKLIYRYTPASITSLDDTILFDDYISNTLIATMLASRLLLSENAELANFFNDKAEEYKREIKTKQPAPITKRIDKYDASCKF